MRAIGLMRRVAVWFGVLLLAYLTVAAISPPALGMWQDDANYLVTAKSLAEGHGYRLAHIPGQPYQTKAPIGYPAILALMWMLSPGYPDNLALLLAPGAAAAAGFVVLAAAYVRRVLGAPGWMAVTVGVLSALSPEILSLVRFTMSDLVFALFSIAALWCLDGKYLDEPSAPRRRRWLLASALLVAAALMTRTLGLALWGAALATLLVRRRWLAAIVMLGIVAGCLLPWQWWLARAAAQNATLATSPLDAYSLSYGLWLPQGAAEIARVVLHNAFMAVLATGYTQLALPQTWAMGLTEGSWRLLVLHGACWSIVILMLAGFAAGARRSLTTLHLYAALYLAMMLAWPFEPTRFLTPWVPFILYFLLEGVVDVSRRVLERMAPDRARRLVLLPAGVVALLLAGLFLAEDRDILLSRRDDYSFMRQHIDLRQSDRLFQWIATHTAPGDVLASNHTAELYIATGRQGHDFADWSNPVAMFYGADRTWWQFFAIPGRSELQWLYDQANSNIERLYREARVSYYVDDRDHPLALAMRQFLAMRFRQFELVFLTDAQRPTYRVYRFTSMAGSAGPQ